MSMWSMELPAYAWGCGGTKMHMGVVISGSSTTCSVRD
jgi:hypothetical protein